MNGRLFSILLTVVIGLGILVPVRSAAAQEGTLPVPTIVVTETNEDDEHLVLATVTLDGEPVEGVEVLFSIPRKFGRIELGSEETYDDGIAAVEFPEGMPGDEKGRFEIAVRTEGDDELGPASGSGTFSSGVAVSPVSQMFPGALWSARPLWPLVIVIGILLTGVWSTFAVVVVQLIKIHRKESSP